MILRVYVASIIRIYSNILLQTEVGSGLERATPHAAFLSPSLVLSFFSAFIACLIQVLLS